MELASSLLVLNTQETTKVRDGHHTLSRIPSVARFMAAHLRHGNSTHLAEWDGGGRKSGTEGGGRRATEEGGEQGNEEGVGEQSGDGGEFPPGMAPATIAMAL
jgi:hypothetical protein